MKFQHLVFLFFFSLFISAQARAQTSDIISTTLYGTEEDLERILKAPAETFKWTTYKGAVHDARDVALFYALSCNKLMNVPLLLKNGADWTLEHKDMPEMKKECEQRRLTDSHVREAIIQEEKYWDESEIDGDCNRGEHLHDVVSSHEAFALLLEHDPKTCSYKTRCGADLFHYLRERKDMQYLNIYKKFCKK